MIRVSCLCAFTILIPIAGCNSFEQPLIFGKVDNFGLNASVTAPDQGGSFSAGYRSAKVAIVPVVARDGQGQLFKLKENRGSDNTGAFSTFAHFEASGNGFPAAKACLGDTFATGIAAQAIAERLERVCR